MRKIYLAAFSLLCSCTDVANHRANAQRWVENLGVGTAKIDCDPGAWFTVECGCTVRYTDESKLDHIVRIECCGSGCVVRPGGTQ